MKNIFDTNMNLTNTYRFILVLFGLIIVLLLLDCGLVRQSNPNQKDDLITNVDCSDTIDLIMYHNEFILNRTIANYNDSLQNVRDSLIISNNKLKLAKDTIKTFREELFVSNYKLERIREYNRIAAQGNNIKFLRGWINRVLKD